jgi:adenine-specific DNA-methyltransferase
MLQGESDMCLRFGCEAVNPPCWKLTALVSREGDGQSRVENCLKRRLCCVPFLTWWKSVLDKSLKTRDDLDGLSLSHGNVVEFRARRRALGAYYTPDRLSAVIAEWAIDSCDSDVLEPGFGGCGFLLAAKMQLEKLGQTQPYAHIYGCDIDEAAFVHLRQVFEAEPSATRFPRLDFLQTVPAETWGGRRFRVVMGNPPYVAYQAIGEKRNEYQAALARSGWGDLSARASLWAYFVLHALSFLQEGGRIAWVLPGSLLRANYAKYVKEVIEDRFGNAALFHVHERLFSPVGAQEETVILVADGFGQGSTSMQEYSVEHVDELAEALHNWQSPRQMVMAPTAAADTKGLLDTFSDLPTAMLADVLSARIGLVTGDNKYFLFTKSRAREAKIRLTSLLPLVSKGAMARGLSFTQRDLDHARDTECSCYLLSVAQLPAPQVGINRYLETFPKARIPMVSTFKKRARWHQPADGSIPDAFWPVMRDLGPKLILNPLRLHCTNTLHRLFFKPGVTSQRRKVVAICLQSTFAQLHAELSGRSYGSGVLKHEPRDVERIRIPWPEDTDSHHVDQTFKAIDLALREGRGADAMKLADTFVARYARTAYTTKRRTALKKALIAMRAARLPKKNKRAAGGAA